MNVWGVQLWTRRWLRPLNMGGQRMTRPIYLAALVALVAAGVSCGGDDSSDSADTGTDTPAVEETASGDTADGDTDDEAGSTDDGDSGSKPRSTDRLKGSRFAYPRERSPELGR